MIDIIEYIQSPQYHNFFKEFDKKLTKNILKRCVVEPFNDRIMKKSQRPNSEGNMVEATEVEFCPEDTIEMLNTLLKELFKIDKFISNSLKEWISVPLVAYIEFLKGSNELKIKFQQDVLTLSEFARKSSMLDDVFDYYNKDQLFSFFKNKQPHNIERYVKILAGLTTKAIQDNKNMNKKYIKQVFGGENQQC